mgnify:CR=1 FL=1
MNQTTELPNNVLSFPLTTETAIRLLERVYPPEPSCPVLCLDAAFEIADHYGNRAD